MPDIIDAQLREADVDHDDAIGFEEFLALIREAADDAQELQLFETRLL